MGSSDMMLALALSVLLVVVGYRVARPQRALEWIAVVVYVAAIGVLHLAALDAREGAGAPLLLRVAGAAMLLGGLVLAGSGVRAARTQGTPPTASTPPPRRPAVFAGLGMVLAGQLARRPSEAGAAAVTIAVVALAWAAVSAWRRGAPVRST